MLSDGGRRSSPESVSRIARISISLYNCSPESARFPYLIVEKASRIKMPFTAHRGFQQPRGTFYGGADDVVHPDLAIHALDLEFEFTVEHRSGVDYLPRGRLSPNLEVSYRCGCLNSRPKRAKFTIGEEEVVGALHLERA